MQRERSQAAQTARIRVPMRSTGTEQPVIVTKVLQWDWSEGAALVSRGHGSTDAIWQREEPVDEAKPFDIPKREVWEAFKKVKVNQGAAGVDGQSIADFEADLSNNLYKLWNRLSSGSYFPPPVRRVDIPKADGGTRPLGIPTVADRIAQEVARRYSRFLRRRCSNGCRREGYRAVSWRKECPGKSPSRARSSRN